MYATIKFPQIHPWESCLNCVSLASSGVSTTLIPRAAHLFSRLVLRFPPKTNTNPNLHRILLESVAFFIQREIRYKTRLLHSLFLEHSANLCILFLLLNRCRTYADFPF
ncbi:hypothetical protein CGRA01v4_12521 [Colletotrichum graminicola]|nr:hypothetical protein CGRA01v4_12521 [Colletotrichum graminicola]